PDRRSKDSHPAEGLRSSPPRSVGQGDRRDGAAHGRPRRRPGVAAHDHQPLDGAALAACRQDLARAVRDAHAQAPARHRRSHAADRRLADEARLARRRRRRDQAVMARKEALIGRKVGMTQIFGDDGNHVPVTVVQAGPCTIVGVRSKATHGYDALQLGFEPAKKNVSKPRAGHFKKANVSPTRILREVRLDKVEKPYEVGQALTVELFAPGEIVDVVGVTKGKGFQGGVKRHGWLGGEATHGSMFHRAPGSIGASSDPSRVWPGHKLPGRMGGVQRTVLNVTVARVLPEQNLILIRGAVPGANGSLVMVRKSIKTTKAQQQKAAEKK